MVSDSVGIIVGGRAGIIVGGIAAFFEGILVRDKDTPCSTKEGIIVGG